MISWNFRNFWSYMDFWVFLGIKIIIKMGKNTIFGFWPGTKGGNDILQYIWLGKNYLNTWSGHLVFYIKYTWLTVIKPSYFVKNRFWTTKHQVWYFYSNLSSFWTYMNFIEFYKMIWLVKWIYPLKRGIFVQTDNLQKSFLEKNEFHFI